MIGVNPTGMEPAGGHCRTGKGVLALFRFDPSDARITLVEAAGPRGARIILGETRGASTGGRGRSDVDEHERCRDNSVRARSHHQADGRGRASDDRRPIGLS